MNWISTVTDLAGLAKQADFGLTEVEKMSKQGIVSDKFLANSKNSFLYMDNGVLMFYNATTQTKTTVTVT